MFLNTTLPVTVILFTLEVLAILEGVQFVESFVIFPKKNYRRLKMIVLSCFVYISAVAWVVSTYVVYDRGGFYRSIFQRHLHERVHQQIAQRPLYNDQQSTTHRYNMLTTAVHNFVRRELVITILSFNRYFYNDAVVVG